MPYTVLDRMWITNATCFGLVVTENSEGQRKIRGCEIDGENQEEDEQYVAANGSTVDPSDLQRLIDLVSTDKGDE